MLIRVVNTVKVFLLDRGRKASNANVFALFNNQ